jgi:hypothetical protein
LFIRVWILRYHTLMTAFLPSAWCGALLSRYGPAGAPANDTT